MNQRIFITLCMLSAALVGLVAHARVNTDSATNRVSVLTSDVSTNATAIICAAATVEESNAVAFIAALWHHASITTETNSALTQVCASETKYRCRRCTDAIVVSSMGENPLMALSRCR